MARGISPISGDKTTNSKPAFRVDIPDVVSVTACSDLTLPPGPSIFIDTIHGPIYLVLLSFSLSNCDSHCPLYIKHYHIQSVFWKDGVVTSSKSGLTQCFVRIPSLTLYASWSVKLICVLLLTLQYDWSNEYYPKTESKESSS